MDYTSAVAPNSAEVIQKTPTVRCDNMSYFPTLSGGCVMPDVEPTLEMSLSDPTVTDAAQFYLDTQNTLPYHDGSPDQTVAGGPYTLPLIRMYNPQQRDVNRRRACPPPEGLDPTVPNPSCDEYPFASTYNASASTVKSRTVPLEQNRKAGSYVSAFLTKNHIIDGDAWRLAIVL